MAESFRECMRGIKIIKPSKGCFGIALQSSLILDKGIPRWLSDRTYHCDFCGL